MSNYHWAEHCRRILCVSLLLFAMALCGAVPWARAQSAPDVWIDELIVEVVKDPYRLSEAMIVIQEDNRFFAPVSELAGLMDIVAELEYDRGYVGGWAVREENTYAIDVPRGEIVVRGEKRALSPDDVMTAEEYEGAVDDIFISIDVLEEIWPVILEVDFSTLQLKIETTEPLPFELRIMREQKRELVEARKKYAPSRNLDLPLIPNDYKLFSLPAVDIDTQHRWDQNERALTGQATVTGTMDLLGFSTNFGLSSSYADGRIERPRNLRLTGTRKAYGDDDIALGFREVQVGDTRVMPRDLIGNSVTGRGMVASTREIEQVQEFDQITVEGDAQPGWETELYRNNELLDFGVVDEVGRYRFENVQLMVGNNTVRVVLYGPQGQVEERSENYIISGSMVRPGEFSYEVGAVDDGRDFIPIEADPRSGPRGVASTAYGAYGVSEGLTVFAGASRIPVEIAQGKAKNYGSVGAMFNALDGLAQVELYKEMSGGTALDMRFVGEFLGIRLNAQHSLYRDFQSPDAGFGPGRKRMESDVSLNKNLRTGFGSLGLQLDVNNQELDNDTSLTTINTRQSIGRGGIRLSHQTTTSLRDKQHQTSSGSVTASTRIRQVNLRGTLNYDIYPDFRGSSFQADARYTEENGFSAGIDVQHDMINSISGVGAQVGYDFGKFLASFDVDWLQERGVQLMLRASTSLAPYDRDGGYMMSSDKLSIARPVRTRIFLDNDGDNVFGDGDEPLPDARVQVGLRSSEEVTDADGYVVAMQSGGFGGISSVQVDKASLADPYYIPGVEGYNTVPREGTIVDVVLPVVQTGAIDGTVMRADGNAIGGMKLELVNAQGEVVMTTDTAYDGFYTFDYVRMGTYTVRPDPTYEVNVPPVTVTVASEELFAYGMDLELPEQAEEGQAADANAVTADADAATDSGGVAQTHHAEETTIQPAPQSSGGPFKAAVKGVRIGEHPDKVRLVLDLSAPAAYSIAPVDGGSALAVDLPDTAWDAMTTWRSEKTPVMQSFTTQALPSGGTRIVIQGRGPIAAIKHGVLKPAEGRGDRLFIDLQAVP